jgi:hypothetical protein
MANSFGKNVVKLASNKKFNTGSTEVILYSLRKADALKMLIGTPSALNTLQEIRVMDKNGQTGLTSGTSAVIHASLFKTVMAYLSFQKTLRLESVKTMTIGTLTVLKWLMEDLAMAVLGEMELNSGLNAAFLAWKC